MASRATLIEMSMRRIQACKLVDARFPDEEVPLVTRGVWDYADAAAAGSVAGSRAAGDVEEDLWLCPVEDRRRLGGRREGLLEGFSLGSYLLLLDYTSRLCRLGKARVSREVASILERLGSSAEVWGQRIQKLLGKSRLLGSYFSTDRARLRELARQRGVHHLDNLVSAPA